MRTSDSVQNNKYTRWEREAVDFLWVMKAEIHCAR